MMFARFYRAVRASYYWVQALSEAGAGNYDAALASLDSYQKFIPSMYSVFLLRGFLLYSKRNYDGAIAEIKLARAAIGEAKKLNSDEKMYLYAYATSLANTAVMKGGRGGELEKIDLRFNVDNVDQLHKKHFPVNLDAR